MPTYEYLCQTCSHRFEIWQKMADEPLNTCPECGNHIRRVFFPAGIVFKGSGFYKTDHSSSGSAGSSNGHSGEKTETPAAEKTTTSTPPSENGSGAKSASSSESKTTSAA